MPRQARKDLGTSFIHVMVQGVNKEYIFYKEEYIEKYGSECDYVQLFKQSYEKRYLDIKDEKNDTTEEYILEGIREFKKQETVEIVEILSNREIFKRMIYFLKESCGLKYVEIRNFFEIPRGTMDVLKIK